MKNFIYGCIFMGLAIPIFNSLVTIINQIFQYIYNIFYLKTIKQEQEMQELIGEETIEQPCSTPVIGFQIPSREEEYDDYDE